MKVIAAHLLAVLGGNSSPTKDDLKAILASVGADSDDGKIEYLLEQARGKNLDELIEVGRERMALDVPAAGGGGGCAVSAAAPTGGGAAPAAETKKEERKEEKQESDDEESFFSLFE